MVPSPCADRRRSPATSPSGRCQLATLETLLGNLSPNGQIPTNVAIDSGRPDYSGTAASAPSTAACGLSSPRYEYTKATHDLEFLRRHPRCRPQRDMDCSAPTTATTTPFLEIPRKPVTDRPAGRSYNVLYDEILWYRANICFGRMLELLGKMPGPATTCAGPR